MKEFSHAAVFAKYSHGFQTGQGVSFFIDFGLVWMEKFLKAVNFFFISIPVPIPMSSLKACVHFYCFTN